MLFKNTFLTYKTHVLGKQSYFYKEHHCLFSCHPETLVERLQANFQQPFHETFVVNLV